MSLDMALQLAREARLYPGVILHGVDAEGRSRAAVELGRTLLCERAGPQERPCRDDDLCRHCSRISTPSKEGRFHPDFQYLERDLKTSTSVDAVKGALKSIQFSPFEARGQVLVIASAETLSPSAANALLKSLEEPPTSAPRHFLLLTPAATDLLETLRSRCLSLYLGSTTDESAEQDLEAARGQLMTVLEGLSGDSPSVHLHGISEMLLKVDDFSDPRALRPWSRAARLIVECAQSPSVVQHRAALLQLAHELLEAPEVRMRSIPAARIVEGLVARTLVVHS